MVDQVVPEEVVLLGEAGQAIGTAAKSEVHHSHTPLHLAFSTYLFSPAGDLLLTQRALDKATFPGLWTNSVCGHPLPGEALTAAITRRVRAEVGAEVVDLRLVLPEFAYRAEMDGVVEHELCPVHVGRIADPGALHLDPAEVEAATWVGWERFAAEVLAGRRAVSPWCVTQVRLLTALGPDPMAWPDGDRRLLPVAAR